MWPIVHVDLSSGKIERSEMPLEEFRKYLGGRAVNSALLLKHSRGLVRKLRDFRDPENAIIISAGVLTGTVAPSSSRLEISSLMTPWGFFGDGNVGGDVGANFRRTGIGSLIITGESEDPVFLDIRDIGNIKFRKADKLWGKPTHETVQELRKKESNPASVLTIGQAGERGIPGSVIMSGSGRCVARSGIGAVFGAKKLKAIVVEGSRDIVPRMHSFFLLSKQYHEKIQSHDAYKVFSKYGTTSLVAIYNDTKNLPTRNWQEGTFGKWKEISGDKFHEDCVTKKQGCSGCSIHCGTYYKTEEGHSTQGVNYDSLNDFGSKIGASDMKQVLKLTELCNQFGLDVVYASSVISTLMHLYQDGFLQNFTCDLEWGSCTGPFYIIMDIVYQRDECTVFTSGLLPGLKRLEKREKVKPGTFTKYAIHCKGVPFSSYDPRTLKGASLGAITSTRGADHLRSLAPPEAYGKHYYSVEDPELLKDELDIPQGIVEKIFSLDLLDPEVYEGKEYLVKFYQENNAISDSVGTCRFSSSWRFGIGPSRLAELVAAFLRVDITESEILEVGERCYAIEMELLHRAGFDADTDVLPDRFYDEELPPSNAKVDFLKMEELKTRYYQLCGYNTATGRPLAYTLKRLGIGYER